MGRVKVASFGLKKFKQWIIALTQFAAFDSNHHRDPISWLTYIPVLSQQVMARK